MDTDTGRGALDRDTGGTEKVRIDRPAPNSPNISRSGPGGREGQQARARENSQSDSSVAVAAESARPAEPGREFTSVRGPSWLGEVPCNRSTMRRVVAPVNARPVQRRTPDLPGRVIVGRTPPTRWNVPAAGRARWWCARSRTAPNQFGFASGFAERACGVEWPGPRSVSLPCRVLYWCFMSW